MTIISCKCSLICNCINLNNIVLMQFKASLRTETLYLQTCTRAGTFLSHHTLLTILIQSRRLSTAATAPPPIANSTMLELIMSMLMVYDVHARARAFANASSSWCTKRALWTDPGLGSFTNNSSERDEHVAQYYKTHAQTHTKKRVTWAHILPQRRRFHRTRVVLVWFGSSSSWVPQCTESTSTKCSTYELIQEIKYCVVQSLEYFNCIIQDTLGYALKQR